MIASLVFVIDLYSRKTTKILTAHDHALSPLNNLLQKTNPETVTKLMDFGLWEYHIDRQIFTLSPKSRELLGLDQNHIQLELEQLIETIHPSDQQLFLTTFKQQSGNHFFLEIRTKKLDIYYRWLRFEGQQSYYAHGQTIYAGRLVEATTKVLVKRIQIEMRELLTDVIENNDVEEILLAICQKVTQLEPAISCVVFLDSKRNDAPKLIHVEHLSAEFQSILKTVTLGEEKAEYFYTTQKRRPLYISNLHRLTAWRSIGEISYKEHVKSYIGQTIFSNENHLQGAIALYMPNNHLPQQVLEVMLGAIHKIASIAIESKLQRDAKDRIQQQLYHSQKMDTIGNLTGGIAHDFNNILGSIVGYNGLARKMADRLNNSQLSGYINEVSIAAQRARELIDQMMSYSRAEPVEKLIIEPQMIVKEVIQLVKSMMPSSIEINSRFSKSLPKIQISPISLHQILLNLLINAKDALSEYQGAINLHTYPVYKVNHRCHSCDQIFTGDYVAIEIIDNGSGMSPEVVHKIFEPFFTTKDVGQGTGMGLSVVHGLLHDANSHVTVESKLGHGTTFTLYFPQQDEVPELDQPNVTSQSIEHDEIGSGQHILVVDDDIPLSILMEEILINAGYMVSRFESGNEAYNAFKTNPDIYDLVLTDQTMPVMTGDEMAIKMLSIKPSLPIVVCTGFSEKLTKELAESIGIRTVMKKPIDISTLLEEISKQLSEK